MEIVPTFHKIILSGLEISFESGLHDGNLNREVHQKISILVQFRILYSHTWPLVYGVKLQILIQPCDLQMNTKMKQILGLLKHIFGVFSCFTDTYEVCMLCTK